MTTTPNTDDEYEEVIVFHLTNEELDHIERGGEVYFEADDEATADRYVVTDDIEGGTGESGFRVDGTLQ